MTASNLFKLFLLCSIAFSFMQCSEDEEQRDFEQMALRPPSGIVAMSANGTPVEDGESDPDDWRIAPEFLGIFIIETAAFPNPVAFNSSFEILISINSFQAVNGLRIFAFQQPSQMGAALIQETGPLNIGVRSIRLSPQQFASSTGTGNVGDLYRIIIYDGRGDVISYGDVQIE